MKLFIILGALNAMMAVGTGAFGAHGLQGKISDHYLSVWIHRNLVTTVFIGFGVPNGSLNYILSKILVVFLSSSLNFSSNK